MLSHALRSRYIDPGRPPAADGGLRSQYPDLVLSAQQPLDCRQLRQAGRRVLTRSFDRCIPDPPPERQFKSPLARRIRHIGLRPLEFDVE